MYIRNVYIMSFKNTSALFAIHEHPSGPQRSTDTTDPWGLSQRCRSLSNFLRGLLTVQSSRSKAMPIGRQYNYWPRRMLRHAAPRLAYHTRLAYVLAACCV